MTPTLRLDPNPCRLYRWPAASLCTAYSGSHVCGRKGGHTGACRCACCEKRGRGRDITDAPTEPTP
jgi:hypothetical protein